MSRTRTRFLAIGLAVLLSACVNTPPLASIEADAGPVPDPDKASVAIQMYLVETLRDYQSMRDFEIASGPKKITWTRPPNAREPYGAAWLYCLRYNAKNAYGGYTGRQGDRVALRVEDSLVVWVRTVNWDAANGGC